jgi:hypothetical protein
MQNVVEIEFKHRLDDARVPCGKSHQVCIMGLAEKKGLHVKSCQIFLSSASHASHLYKEMFCTCS